MEKPKDTFEKKAKTLKERVRKDEIENEKRDSSKRRTINGKICPFMSTLNKQVACTPQCKIHRANKKGYECSLSELASISWNLKNKNKK